MKRDWGCKKETENLLIYKLCISIFYIRTYANVIFLLSVLRRTSNTVGKVSSCSNRQEQCALYTTMMNTVMPYAHKCKITVVIGKVWRRGV